MSNKIDRIQISSRNGRFSELPRALGQAGFSLIEMMIAGVILSLLITAFLQFTGMQQKALVTSEANFDTLDFVNQVRMVLSDPPSCKRTFGGQPISGGTAQKIIRTYEDPSTHAFSDQDFVTVGKNVGTTLQVSAISVEGSSPFDGMGSATFKIKRIKNGVMGGTDIIRNVPLHITPDPTNPSLIGECYAWGSASGGPGAFCAAMGTTFDAAAGKCKDMASELISPEIATCGPGSRVQLVSVDGKIKVQCTPCTQKRVFDHFECGKPNHSDNWINMCFYKTACEEDPSVILTAPLWDGLKGPTSASGGDTGTKDNCFDKRHRCAGEL